MKNFIALFLMLLWDAPVGVYPTGYNIYRSVVVTDIGIKIGTTTNTQWPLVIDYPQAFYTVSAFYGSAPMIKLLPPKLKP